MVQSGRSAEYLQPSGWRRRGRRRSWLRTARLNVVGWSALLGACLVVAALGIATTTALAWPRALGAAGAVIPVAAVIFADRRRWARMETSVDWGGSVEEVARIADELESEGVHARVRPDAPGSPWRVGADPPPDTAEATTAALEYRNGDLDVVRKKLREHGVRPPALP
jgi:hypothetical protein